MKPTYTHQHRHTASRRQGGKTTQQTGLYRLKRFSPWPALMEHLGFGKHPKPSSKSPLRTDNDASRVIFNSEIGWRFADHGTGESGDGTVFQPNHPEPDQVKNLATLREICRAVAQNLIAHGTPKAHPATAQPIGSAEEPMFLPVQTGFGPGTVEQHRQLARVMDVGIEAVNWAVERGVLVFGEWQGLQCYGGCDASGRLLELRRLNGLNFPAFGELQERPSHTVKHSQKNWPVGLPEAGQAACLLLVNGLADFIAAHEMIVANQLDGRWAPVAMLSAEVQISKDALPCFNGKQVLICFHNDAEHRGSQEAVNWHRQLQAANCAQISLLDYRKLNEVVVGSIKDMDTHPSPIPAREFSWRQWLRHQLQRWGHKFNGLRQPALQH